MPAIIEGPPAPGDPRPALWRRIAWFAGIALASATVTATVAYALKALLPR